MKLMIVDDSSIIRSAISKYLDDYDLEIVGYAGDGEEALEVFQDKNPDVVTMDITMPRMDGIECVERMVNKNPDVRILVVSALADIATGIEALEKGARGFLCKPFSDEQLRDALQELTEDMNVRASS